MTHSGRIPPAGDCFAPIIARTRSRNPTTSTSARCASTSLIDQRSHCRLPVHLFVIRRPDNFFDDDGRLLENCQSRQRSGFGVAAIKTSPCADEDADNDEDNLLYPNRMRVVEAACCRPIFVPWCALVRDSRAWYTRMREFAATTRDEVSRRRGLDAMAEVVALIDDLFFQAKVIETAKHVGVELRICGTPAALVEEIAKQTPRLIVVDLNARSQPLAAIEQLPASAREIPLVAFLSHVQTDLAAQARAAGCHEVLPRSIFTRDLATILSRAKSQSS